MSQDVSYVLEFAVFYGTTALFRFHPPMHRGNVFGGICLYVRDALTSESLDLKRSFLVCRYTFMIFRQTSSIYELYLKILKMYQNHRVKVKVTEKKKSSRYCISAGVRQNGVLSPVCSRVVCLRLKGNLVPSVCCHRDLTFVTESNPLRTVDCGQHRLQDKITGGRGIRNLITGCHLSPY